jgi:hypothetical protein
LSGSAERLFFTDALRDENSTEWYWETSGNRIQDTDFHWGKGKPSLENSTGCLGIVFSAAGAGGLGGAEDVDCLNVSHDVMCQ